MNIKKMTAALTAAAVLAVAAPVTGVMPDVMSVSAYVAGQYNVVDVFFTGLIVE